MLIAIPIGIDNIIECGPSFAALFPLPPYTRIPL